MAAEPNQPSGAARRHFAAASAWARPVPRRDRVAKAGREARRSRGRCAGGGHGRPVSWAGGARRGSRRRTRWRAAARRRSSPARPAISLARDPRARGGVVRDRLGDLLDRRPRRLAGRACRFTRRRDPVAPGALTRLQRAASAGIAGGPALEAVFARADMRPKAAGEGDLGVVAASIGVTAIAGGPPARASGAKRIVQRGRDRCGGSRRRRDLASPASE